VWNEPNPIGSEAAAGEAAYASWVNAMEQTGGSYSVWSVHGWVTYTVGWSMDTGPFWIGPNGLVVGNEWAAEAGLPALPGPQTDQGALSTAAGIGYQRYQTGVLLNQLNPVPRLKAVAKWYLCGSSPGGAILNWTVSGATKGAGAGAIAGFSGGEVAGGLLGVPGALLGAYVGGHIGAVGGSLWGTAAAVVCSALGVYGR
jgi:hypothetical protein